MNANEKTTAAPATEIMSAHARVPRINFAHVLSIHLARAHANVEARAYHAGSMKDDNERTSVKKSAEYEISRVGGMLVGHTETGHVTARIAEEDVQRQQANAGRVQALSDVVRDVG